MRITLATEEEPWPDGRVIAADAIKWDNRPIPVTHQGNFDQVIGKVTDIRRESDGRITGELELKFDDNAIGYFIQPVMYDPDDPNRVLSGHLREVSIHNPIPGMKKD